ncbi:MAG: ABC transporter permease [Actinobacteria bacterium]|nr:ABC transporter permease [Actinomycetota bacterium]
MTTKQSATARPGSLPAPWWLTVIRPELGTLVLLVISFWVGSSLSPYFLDARFLFDSTSLYMEVGVAALAMTFVIIAGQIDLSVASAMALVACVTAVLYRSGLAMVLTVVAGLFLGVCLGFFNGLLVTRLRLPALTVTLGTLALYRGIAQILLGDHSLGRFPDWFIGIDLHYLGSTIVPLPLAIFLVLAVALGLVLHRTVFGRWVYSIGTNELAARYSGIPVDRTKMLIFGLSGLAAAAGGLMMMSRLGVARFDMATGRELDVITAVVLGGTDIFGGRGSILGTVIALFLVGILRTGMGVANIKAENQLTVIGGLLILAIVLSNIAFRKRR